MLLEPWIHFTHTEWNIYIHSNMDTRNRFWINLKLQRQRITIIEYRLFTDMQNAKQRWNITTDHWNFVMTQVFARRVSMSCHGCVFCIIQRLCILSKTSSTWRIQDCRQISRSVLYIILIWQELPCSFIQLAWRVRCRCDSSVVCKLFTFSTSLKLLGGFIWSFVWMLVAVT